MNERMINMYLTKENEPLLYIDQPSLEVPKSKMQADFYTSTEKAKIPIPKKHNKSFKQYSIPEKIYYLLHLPKGLPQVKCEVVTNQEVYRGWLVNENDSFILLENFKRRKDEIAKNDILDIYLISF